MSYEIALRWMPPNLAEYKSTLVQVMAWCHQAASLYLSQCWPRSMSPNGVSRPDWVKSWLCIIRCLTIHLDLDHDLDLSDVGAGHLQTSRHSDGPQWYCLCPGFPQHTKWCQSFKCLIWPNVTGKLNFIDIISFITFLLCVMCWNYPYRLELFSQIVWFG